MAASTNKRILIVFAHPFPQRSRANRIIMQSIRSIPGTTVTDLYEKYPYFFINVREEQKLLVENDIILFQHPFYWYSVPPLLKMWFDSVLEMGFAYGAGGTKIKGKLFQLSITAGGDDQSYTPSGFHQHKIEDFFPPLIQTSNLCGMIWQPPIVLKAALQQSDDAIHAHAEMVRLRLVELANPSFTPGRDIS